MENVKEIHKHHFITANGDEYPLFDADITVEEMDDMINHSSEMINGLKKAYEQVIEH